MKPLETILNRKDIVSWIYSMLLFSDPQIPSRKQNNKETWFYLHKESMRNPPFFKEEIKKL